MGCETGGLASLDILIHPVPGEGYPDQALAVAQLGHEITTVAIGQPDIRDQEIESLLRRDRPRLGHAFRADHLELAAIEEMDEGGAGRRVILNQKNAARPPGGVQAG